MFVSVLVLILTAAPGTGIGSASGETYAHISVFPKHTITNCSTDTSVVFFFTPIGDISGVRGYEVSFCINPDVVTVTNITEGSFLREVGSTLFYAEDNGGGSYTVSCAILGGSSGASDTGDLFDVDLSPVAEGTGVITINSIDMRDPDNTAVAADGADGTIEVSCPPQFIFDCPGNTTIPGYSTIPTLSLVGFRITNDASHSAAFSYYITAEGPLTLVDKGDPLAFTGMTPSLPPGATFYLPEAALEIPAMRDYSQETITYHVYPAGYSSDLDSCVTVVTIEPPVAVLINRFEARTLAAGVELLWDVSSDDEKVRGFRIYRSIKGEKTRRLVNSAFLIPAGAWSYVDDGIQPGRSYDYTLHVVMNDNSEISSGIVAVKIRPIMPVLFQIYPNPFNPSTTIGFTLSERVHVNLSILNTEGKLVRTLVDTQLPVGVKEVMWDGTDGRGNRVSSGVYFYRLRMEAKTLTKKILMLK